VFVEIGGGRALSGGAGYLGVEYNPFLLSNALRLPANVTPTTDAARFEKRLGLLDQLETDFAATDGRQAVADHQKLYGKAARMVMSSQMAAFDINRED